MNKLYKCALGLLTTFILSFACFSNADYLDGLEFKSNVNWTSNSVYSTKLSNLGYSNSVGGLVCFKINDFGGSDKLRILYVNNQNIRYSTESTYHQKLFGCFGFSAGEANDYSIYIQNQNQYAVSFNIDFYYLPVVNVVSGNPGYTSLECQTEYNLIPVEEVTPNYCALNFGMIDPQECPINEGTGAIVRSNLMINDVPYAQNQNINVFIPDFLAWNISFNDLYTVIEVEGYNADESYIENVINQEKLTPTNKDIEEMLKGFMVNYFPYLALAIVFLYLARKIYKLFK